MKKTITAGLILATLIGFNAVAQDWYHDRDDRYRGEGWRSQLFLQVRSDLDNVWLNRKVSDKERNRLERTKQELTDLQANLDRGYFDNGHVNDVIDSLRKSANDDRLAPRDRDILMDDMNRIKDYQRNHNHWNR